MNGKRQIINVISSSRADYGLLRWLIEALREINAFEVQLTVTGTHLVAQFGETWREIEDDGTSIDFRVPVSYEDDSVLGMANVVGNTVMEFAGLFSRSRPDLVVVLGDRFEIMAVSEAAFLSRIPVAHLHGGEITSGALDDTMRHVITKLSSLHFVAADDYKRRVIQLGEDPQRVHVVGAMSLDGLEKLKKLTLPELAEKVGLNLRAPFALVTMHPETALSTGMDLFLRPLLDAIVETSELQVIFTRANADPGGRQVNLILEEFVRAHSQRMTLVSNLGSVGYLSALGLANVVIGNSSSGIVEAPSVGTPTVNIGDRQAGRLRAPSVLDVGNSATEIVEGVKTALTPDFVSMAERRISPFGDAGAAERITTVLRNTDFASLLPKAFYDVSFSEGMGKA